MWWNPINAIKHVLEERKKKKIEDAIARNLLRKQNRLKLKYKKQTQKEQIYEIRHQECSLVRSTSSRNQKKKKPLYATHHPTYEPYPTEGDGTDNIFNSIDSYKQLMKLQNPKIDENNEKYFQWKFLCSCGERCSWFQKWQDLPFGIMFECSECQQWSHLDCVYGNKTEDELDELEVSSLIQFILYYIYIYLFIY